MGDNVVKSFSDQQLFFARVEDVVFWADTELVKTLILLYEQK